MGREARCEKELKELITSKFNDITKENCDGFYRKILGYYILMFRFGARTQTMHFLKCRTITSYFKKKIF